MKLGIACIAAAFLALLGSEAMLFDGWCASSSLFFVGAFLCWTDDGGDRDDGERVRLAVEPA